MSPLTLVSLAQSCATRFPDKPFVIHWRNSSTAALTFGDLWRRAKAVSWMLAQRGVTRGSVVAISHETSLDIYSAFLGTMILGAIPTIMPHPNAKQSEEIYWTSHRALFRDIRPAAVILSPRVFAVYAQHMPHLADRLVDMSEMGEFADPFPGQASDPSDIAFLQHSSGTTSLKKGVMLSHLAVIEHVLTYANTIGMTAESEVVSWLPLYHDMGLIACFMAPLVMGATVTTIDPFEWVARPRMFLDAVAARRAQFAWMPNFGFAHLVNAIRNPEAFDLSSLRALINCSEPCRAATHDKFVAHFSHAGFRPSAMQSCYAMAENVFAVSQTPSGQQAAVLHLQRSESEAGRVVSGVAEEEGVLSMVSCGALLPGVEIRILDESRRSLGPGLIGEIAIRTPTLFRGYNHRPDLTQRALVDGWYHTGDIGFLHEGELYVTGRRDDMILAYGRNLMAHELEAEVNLVDGVHPGRAVVFGVDSETLGTSEIVVMVELVDPSPDTTGVIRAIRSHMELSSGISPRVVQVLGKGELLKTTSGKISRSANRERYLLRSALSLAAPMGKDQVT